MRIHCASIKENKQLLASLEISSLDYSQSKVTSNIIGKVNKGESIFVFFSKLIRDDSTQRWGVCKIK